MKLGFIGTGALTSAVVTGLKSVVDIPVSVLLSPRNSEVAAGLAARFPDVRVAPDNQAVLDGCDIVMLAVRPQIAQEVLSELRFHRRHHVVSMIATLSREDIAVLSAPAERVTKALPMPMIAHHQGATIICPPDQSMAALFGRLGKVVAVEQSSEFDALSVVTATYATYFKYLDTIHSWLTEQGVSASTGRDYITALFAALAKAPEAAPDASFTDLAKDYATRGGINEQVVRRLTDRKMFDELEESLDDVHRRIAASSP